VLLQQGNNIGSNQEVTLSVTALAPEIQKEHPPLRYAVVACGGGSFRGKLVLGGDARLTDVQASPASATGMRDEPNFIIRDPLSNSNSSSNIELGPARIVDIEMANLPDCIPRSSPGLDDLGFSGVVQDITGLAGAPVQRSWELGWWTGPRKTQAWPLIGTMPGVPLGLGGTFEGVSGLSGSWTIPTRRFDVYGGAVNPRTTIDIVNGHEVLPVGGQ
jgi:hypothetical protein